jgi:hypothetical protein
MYSLACTSCGEKNTVESFLTAPQKLCTKCGQPIMGGKAAQPDDGRKPWERLEEAGDQIHAGSRDAWLRGIAGINFFYGFLYLIWGLFWVFASGLATSDMGKEAVRTSITLRTQGGTEYEGNRTVLYLMAYLSLGLAAALYISGYGLLQRSPWGRYMSLVVAGFVALLLISDVMNSMFLALIVHLTYVVATVYILFRRDVVNEFHPPATPAE